MDKVAFKRKVLEEAKKRQQEIIDDFRTRIEEIKSSEMVSLEGQYDYGQQALDETSNLLINKLADQLNFVLAELDELKELEVHEEIAGVVVWGCVVETDQMTFFPSVSIEKFNVGEKELFGISREAPLYKVMKGKKIGERFSYNDRSYLILDIY